MRVGLWDISDIRPIALEASQSGRVDTSWEGESTPLIVICAFICDNPILGLWEGVIAQYYVWSTVWDSRQ